LTYIIICFISKIDSLIWRSQQTFLLQNIHKKMDNWIFCQYLRNWKKQNRNFCLSFVGFKGSW
jgi:hypothetical protein